MHKLKINLDDSDYLLVPYGLIDSVFANAKPEYIKIYIMLMKLASDNNGSVNMDAIKKSYSIPQGLLEEAIGFWAEKELFIYENKTVSFKKKSHSEILQKEYTPKYMPGEISLKIKDDAQLRNLLTLVQGILGKTLSSAGVEILYSFYDWLGMSPSVIVRMIEYCVSIGKRDMKYIEKVALSWHQMGIDSLKMADDYVAIQNKRNKYIYKIKNIIGINSRNLTKSELQYAENWYYNLKASADLVETCFDYCVSKTGKVSFAYMNKVLESWISQGIKTSQQALKSIEEYAQTRKSVPTGKSATGKNTEMDAQKYDYQALDNAIVKKMIDKAKRGGQTNE